MCSWYCKVWAPKSKKKGSVRKAGSVETDTDGQMEEEMEEDMAQPGD